MLTYIVAALVVLAIVELIALHNAQDFSETGYDPRCFDCNKTDCKGCVVADIYTKGE